MADRLRNVSKVAGLGMYDVLGTPSERFRLWEAWAHLDKPGRSQHPLRKA
jgi:hypothetical protein